MVQSEHNAGSQSGDREGNQAHQRLRDDLSTGQPLRARQNEKFTAYVVQEQHGKL